MNTTQLIILGTGNAMVTRCYNTCFALQNQNDYFMVDAGGGNGILRQCENAGIPFDRVSNMFVTHAHTDHILGVVWVIRKIATLIIKEKYTGNFTIYCHNEVKEALTEICRLTLPQKIFRLIGDRIILFEVKDGEERSFSGMEFTFFDIASTKIKQFGFRVVLPDKQSLVCLGDEPYNGQNEKYVGGCDWLLSEAFCLYAQRDIFKPYEKHHSTALDAGKLAEKLKVNNLVVYHTEDKNLEKRRALYSAEAASAFKGKVYVPDDLDCINLSAK